MKTPITKFPIANELDIVLAHKRAIQICEHTGISLSDKTRFATAISEICRNCLEFAKTGSILFSIYEHDGQYSIESQIEDKGPGIKNLDEILNKPLSNSNYRGVGILHSKKLVDHFDIETSSSGTKVSLGIKVPPNHPPINKIIIKGWNQHFEKNVPVSPYEEIKKQNMQLLDVTEQLKLKNVETEYQFEEIKILNSQLQKANIELQDFAYTISHDIKSPINNLEQLASHLLKSDYPESSRVYVKAIETSVQKLKHTVLGLVEIIETQNTEAEVIQSIVFEDLFSNIKEQYQEDIVESAAKFISRFEYIRVKYYEAYLYSIMQNLLNNALKYRDIKKKLTIEISTRKEQEYCLMEVKDNGIGMDMTKVGKKIFKPFTRFNTSMEGKGIGLHLVRSMVEKNGGKVEVESEVGKGTTFKIYLKEY